MKRTTIKFSLVLGLLLGLMSAARATSCEPDAVPAGTACVDRYEASVWRVPNATTANAPLVRKIQLGIATFLDLSMGGATQLRQAPDYQPCGSDGANCPGDIYAVSLPSEFPSGDITWFQAQEACTNAGKRLPTSAEWQVAANGTPDSGPDNEVTDCDSASDGPVRTGTRSACVSARGAFDMVGNFEEWVADWVPLSTGCPGWGSLSNDRMCLSGASAAAGGPGALTRGGSFVDGPGAGPLAVLGRKTSLAIFFIGFRCARNANEPVPAEVDNDLRVSRSGSDTVLTWNTAAGATTSAVLRGLVRGLPVGSGHASELCLIENTQLNTVTDHDLPARGDGFWYLVRGENASGNGSYGFEGLHGVPAAPRVSTTCP